MPFDKSTFWVNLAFNWFRQCLSALDHLGKFMWISNWINFKTFCLFFQKENFFKLTWISKAIRYFSVFLDKLAHSTFTMTSLPVLFSLYDNFAHIIFTIWQVFFFFLNWIRHTKLVYLWKGPIETTPFQTNPIYSDLSKQIKHAK